MRKGRRREFAAFAWRDEVPDPQAEETFARSRLDPERMRRSEHARLYALHRDLLRLRRTEPLLHPGAAAVDVESDAAARWVCLRLGARAGAGALLAIFNFSGERREIRPSHGAGRRDTRHVPAAGRWRVRLSSDAAAYGGSDALRIAVGDRGAPSTDALDTAHGGAGAAASGRERTRADAAVERGALSVTLAPTSAVLLGIED